MMLTRDGIDKTRGSLSWKDSIINGSKAAYYLTLGYFFNHNEYQRYKKLSNDIIKVQNGAH